MAVYGAYFMDNNGVINVRFIAQLFIFMAKLSDFFVSWLNGVFIRLVIF